MSFIFPTQPGYSYPKSHSVGNEGQAVAIERRTIVPKHTIALGLLVFALLWICQLWVTSVAPPEDNIEQLVWTTSMEWGYYKHPPLPTWLLWPLVKIFGPHSVLTFVLAGLTTLGAIAIMWRFLRDLRGPQYALVALLATVCITYYNRRLDVYNHDTVLMVIVALSAMLTWKAHQSGQIKWWAMLGLCLGLGALTKYQIAVTMTCTLAFWLYAGGWKTRAGKNGFAVMCAVISLIFLPHAIWMVQNEFAPIRYAMESSLGANHAMLGRVSGVLHWVAEQLFNRMAPTWLFLLIASLLLKFSKTSYKANSIRPITAQSTLFAKDSRALLMIWGFLPLVFMPFVGLALGSHLQLRWASPFLIFAIPAVFELLRFKLISVRIPFTPIATAFVLTQGLLLTVSFFISQADAQSFLPNKVKKIDPVELAQAIEEQAQNALGGKICLVSGNTELAGGLAMALKDHPSVLIDGRLDRSPWLTQEKLLNCGTLELTMHSKNADAVLVGQQFPGLSWRAIPAQR